MNKLLIVGVLLIAVLLFGCCASSAPSPSTTQGQSVASGVQASQPKSTDAQNTANSDVVNTLSPDVLVNKNVTTLLLSRNDLYPYWSVKDSWDNYKYAPDIQLPAPGAGITCTEPARDCATFYIEKTDVRPYTTLTITVWETNTIDDAIKLFETKKSDLASGLSEKMGDMFLGGNERISAGLMPDEHRTWGGYTVLFRRNNVVVQTYLQNQPLSEKNALIDEAVAYSKIVDKKIQET